MKNICFIPLRKGSKSIPNKNVNLFRGKPLFCWCLEAIIASDIACEIWIATNCEKVKEILVRAYPTVHVFNRCEENAQDASPTIDVIIEFLEQYNYHSDDRLLLFQATSPLTSQRDIALLQTTLNEDKYDSLTACVRMKRFRWTEDGQPLDYTLAAERPRRQDYSGFLVETGAFFMSKVGNLLSTKQLLSGKVGVVEIGSQAIIDIDDPIDWSVGEAYAAFLEKYGSP